MKIGLIARMDNTGLGNQTYDFYKYMKPSKTLVIDMSQLNPGFKQYPERYEGNVRFNKGFLTKESIEWLTDVDLIFTCEIPYSYNYELFKIAREKGVKTVLQYNYEFFDYFNNKSLPEPDLFLAPSKWHYDDIKYENKAFLPVPVDTEVLKYKERKGKTFLHISGRVLLEDRNGTNIFLQAIKYVKDPEARFILYTQHNLEGLQETDPRLEIRTLDVDNYWDLYREGDFWVLPRKFGGLCLQLNEAMASGLIPIMTFASPQNEFLPKELLVQPSHRKAIMTRTLIECWETDPKMLADKMNEVLEMPGLDTKIQSIVKEISWSELRPKYIEMFENICNN